MEGFYEILEMWVSRLRTESNWSWWRTVHSCNSEFVSRLNQTCTSSSGMRCFLHWAVQEFHLDDVLSVMLLQTDRRKPFAVPFFVLWCYLVWRQDVRLGDPGSCSKSTDMPGHSLQCSRHSPANIGPGVPFTISALNGRCRSCQYIVLLLTDGTQI